MSSLFYFLLYLSVLSHIATCRRVIIGGRRAKVGEFPYQVSIRRTYNDKHICGGSIINSLYILTAAHCLKYPWGGVYPSNGISVVSGQIELGITEYSIYRNASKLILHENFNSQTFANDIGLIQLDQDLPVESNKLISKIDLNVKSIESGICVVSGWGVLENDSEVISDNLMTAMVTIVRFSTCKKIYGAYNISVFDGMLCAGHPRGLTDACDADSGGPLVCNGKLAGIVSTGVECGDPIFPGIYADVKTYYSWIQKIHFYHFNIF